MNKQVRNKLLGFAIAFVVLFLIGYLPAETEMMTRAAWQYLGCFVFMLLLIVSRTLPDWAAVLCTMAVLVVLRVATVAQVTAQFSASTVWLCIGVFLMSVGINNSGFMKRLALWILTKFPGTYNGQLTAMMLSGIIMSPIIPSSSAKTAMMAPLVSQVCTASGVEPRSKSALGIWFANFMGTYQLGMAFVSGSVYAVLMMGFIGETISWGRWFTLTAVWYVVCIILTYLFCRIYGKPTDASKVANVDFVKEQYKALGPVSKKEKQGIVILVCALVLWLTQSVHKIDAGMVAILADVAFVVCGLITPPEVGAKGMWTTTLFIGGVLSVGNLMQSLDVSTWMASVIGPVLSPILSSPWIFIPVLCIITYILRYAVVSMSCNMAIIVAIFAPLLHDHGISMFVLVFSSWAASTIWNTPYMNPVVTGMVNLTNGTVDFKTAQKGSYAFVVMNLIAILCCIPYWQLLGLC